MRSKKNESTRKRKYGKKKSNKSKKCGCGMKIPFLKWGGDGANGEGQTNLTKKMKGLFANIKNASNVATSKLTGDFNELTTKSTNAFNTLKDSTTEVIDNTNKDIKNTTTNVLNKVQNNTSNATNKTKGFFTNMFEKASNSIHALTKPKTTGKDNDGSFPSKPISQNKTSTTTSTSSLSNSTGSNSSSTKSTSSNSNSNTQKNYMNNSIAKYRKSIKGGKRRSSKKSKKRRHIYKHKGGTSCMDGPVGIENSSLAFTASPITNINAVGPTPNQMYGQIAYPAWRFSNE